MLEAAWGLIANVDDGLWKQKLLWIEMAAKWRDAYLADCSSEPSTEGSSP